MTESDPTVPFESKRVPLERTIILKFERFSGFIKEYSANISMGGMFVRTNNFKPTGSQFDFAFKLSDDFSLIQGRGEVAWVREEDEGPDNPAGMGIRFKDLDWESRKLIFRLVDQFIQDGGVPFDVDRGVEGRGGRTPEEELTEEVELTAALGLTPEEKGVESGEKERIDPEWSEEDGEVPFWAEESETLVEEQGVVYIPDAIGSSPTVYSRRSKSPWAILLVVFLLASALGAWWWLGRGAQADQAELAESRTESAGQTATQAANSPVETPEPISAVPAKPVEPAEVDRQAITRQVVARTEAWATAWSRQDVPTYLSFYSQSFKPGSSVSRSAWAKQRDNRLRRPRFIRVSLTSLVTEVQNPDLVQMRFNQTYQSDTYRDETAKILDWVFENGEWKILAEGAAS